jgi:RNA polymerase-associated protein
MAEKNIEREIANLKTEEIPEEILDLTPYPTLPTIVISSLLKKG